jgi:predicted pyridoxine 5'-phosphate oxidase superfamily flavin-nucleotide-binding protein
MRASWCGSSRAIEAAIHGQPNEASTVNVAADCSLRGDLPSFVRVHDEKTLLMPNRRGNNRAFSLRNIVRDSQTALFLIRGSDSTLRLNGRAQISIDPGLLTSLRTDGKARREYHAKPRTR